MLIIVGLDRWVGLEWRVNCLITANRLLLAVDKLWESWFIVFKMLHGAPGDYAAVGGPASANGMPTSC